MSETSEINLKGSLVLIEIQDDRSEMSNEPDSDSNQDNEVFDRINVPYERNENEHRTKTFAVKETRDRLILQKDNLIFFVTTKGQPIDNGAKDLAADNRFPTSQNLNLTRSNIKTEKSKHLIALPVKADLRANVALDDVIESF